MSARVIRISLPQIIASYPQYARQTKISKPSCNSGDNDSLSESIDYGQTDRTLDELLEKATTITNLPSIPYRPYRSKSSYHMQHGHTKYRRHTNSEVKQRISVGKVDIKSSPYYLKMSVLTALYMLNEKLSPIKFYSSSSELSYT